MAVNGYHPVVRLAVDTGGTFTDVVVERADGALGLYKSQTTPDDPVRGVIDAVRLAAEDRGSSVADLLGEVQLFIYGTTHPINAVLTGNTAKTALLTTEGNRDVLLFREGGRNAMFDLTIPYPKPYIPRALTFGVPERIGAEGDVLIPLDEQRVIEICRDLKEKGVEAVAVGFLWSIVNPAHELRVGEFLDQHLTGVPYTLSHRVNPIIREYRRISSAAIDASLKPLLMDHLGSLRARLEREGFAGRLMVLSSTGGVMDAMDTAAAPIHCLNSGPSMAPIAGLYYAERDHGMKTAIVADTGGTSYDISLVRNGQIPRTDDTWLGPEWYGHLTGFPSVDVKSIGAGGGSIAHVDVGALLHVGPASAGSVPGPACYGRGGTHPTVTDACVVLGYIDPEYFAGGSIQLDAEASREAIERDVAEPLGVDLDTAAQAILTVATENMVQAIEDITINQGIDPRGGLLVGGGGGAGLNAVAIGRRLGCRHVLIPETGAGLSAAGALMSDLTTDFSVVQFTHTRRFGFDAVNEKMRALRESAEAFAAGPGAGALSVQYQYFVEARYDSQNWDLEIPLQVEQFRGAEDVEQFVAEFHSMHREVFGIDEPDSSVSISRLRLRVSCRLREGAPRFEPTRKEATGIEREMHFADTGRNPVAVRHVDAMTAGESIDGPAIIDSPFTTVVVPPGATVTATTGGGLSVAVFG